MSVALRVFRSSLASAAVLTALSATATTYTWQGTTSGNWSVGTNWVGGTAPGNNETGVDLVFPNAQANMGAMVNDVLNLGVTSITFHDTAYVVTGNAISFGGVVSIDNGTANLAAKIDVAIHLAAPAVFQVSGNPDYWLWFSQPIDGAFPVTVQMAAPFSGTPIVELSAANAYSGTTTVSSAYLGAFNASALGTGNVVVQSGGTLTTGSFTFSNPLSIGGPGQNGNGALQLGNGAVWSGNVTLTANAIFQTSGNATVAGTIDDGGSGFGISFRGNYTLQVNNTYTGLTESEYGTVTLNGTQTGSPVQLDGYGGATDTSILRGGGHVGNVSMGTGPHAKVVDPGLASGLSGRLGILNLSLNDTANGNHGMLHVDINGTLPGPAGYDRADVAGTVDVTNATLEVALGYSPAIGDSFLIVNQHAATAVTGTFAGLPEGATFVAGGRTLQISYVGGDGNDITLTVTSLTPVGLSRFDAD